MHGDDFSTVLTCSVTTPYNSPCDREGWLCFFHGSTLQLVPQLPKQTHDLVCMRCFCMTAHAVKAYPLLNLQVECFVMCCASLCQVSSLGGASDWEQATEGTIGQLEACPGCHCRSDLTRHRAKPHTPSSTSSAVDRPWLCSTFLKESPSAFGWANSVRRVPGPRKGVKPVPVVSGSLGVRNEESLCESGGLRTLHPSTP